MGKKIANSSNVRKEGKKDIQETTKKMTINLHKQLHGVQFKKKAPRAIKIIKKLVERYMRTKDVRIDPELNKELWKKGIRNLETRIELILERKKNEDEKGEKMYTLVKLSPAFEYERNENEEQERKEKELIKKYEESKNYIKNLDKESINKMNLLTNIEITEKNLIEAQLTNKENYTKINNKIDTSCNSIMKNPLTGKEYLKEITTLGTNLKNKIIYEAYNEPDKFIPLKETEKSNMNETTFVEGILAKILIDNKITVSIEKKTSNKDLALTMLQLLSSGEAFQKIINITYDYGEEKNAKIIIDKIEKENFINTKKKKYLFH